MTGLTTHHWDWSDRRAEQAGGQGVGEPAVGQMPSRCWGRARVWSAAGGGTVGGEERTDTRGGGVVEFFLGEFTVRAEHGGIDGGRQPRPVEMGGGQDGGDLQG